MNKKIREDTIEMCLNHFFRPKMYIKKDGVGNCLTCKPSDDNLYCKEYTPISMGVYEVKHE